MGEIKKQTLSGVKWAAIERFSIQGIQFILGIVVARLLMPADYGLVGMVGIFFAISQTLIDSGISTALVRKLDVNDHDFSTTFYYNIVVSVLCAVILFFGAPYIADFFKQEILTVLVRVMSLNLIIGALGGIQGAKLTISLDFKRIAKYNFIAAVISGLSCLALAYWGWGVWSLVWQAIIANTIKTILLWKNCSWRPRLIFSKKSFKDLFGFGNKLMFSGLLNTVYNEMTTIAIGKFYTPASLGNYTRGQNMATLPVSIVTDTLGKVTFPILAKIQEDNKRLIKVYRNYISLVMMVVVFGCMLMSVLAKPLILLLLTSKWAGAIIFLQVYVFAIMFDPICRLNLNLLQVKGRSDLFLRLEIFKKIIAMLILFASIPLGVLAICISKVIYTQIAVAANTYYTGRYFGLGYWQQWKDFLPYIVYSLIACIPTLALVIWSPYNLANVILGLIISTLIYLFILIRTNDSVFMEYVYPYYLQIIHKFNRKGTND